LLFTKKEEFLDEKRFSITYAKNVHKMCEAKETVSIRKTLTLEKLCEAQSLIGRARLLLETTSYPITVENTLELPVANST